jgi:hypothetical protein
MNVPIAKLKVVTSSQDSRLLSLRGPLGRGQGDPIHQHITPSGLKAGDDVVLIRASDYNALATYWNNNGVLGQYPDHNSDTMVFPLAYSEDTVLFAPRAHDPEGGPG